VVGRRKVYEVRKKRGGGPERARGRRCRDWVSALLCNPAKYDLIDSWRGANTKMGGKVLVGAASKAQVVEGYYWVGVCPGGGATKGMG